MLRVTCLHVGAAGSGERIQEGNSVRDLFMKAIYDQIWQNLKSGGVTQGSNFWNLYTAGIGDDDPYQITLADTSTVGIIDAHASHLVSALLLDSKSYGIALYRMTKWR